MTVAKSLGLTIPAISISRRSVIDAQRGDEYLAYGHRLIDTAKEIGAGSVSFGLFEPLTNAQKQALWFWTVDGAKNPDDPAVWKKAVERIRELGRHAEELDIELSLEMYEDTYLGTADSSVRFVEEVGLDNVGINADLGNLIRLHRPVEHWQQMMEKVAPYAKFWHVKNYTRTEDPASGVIVTHPAVSSIIAPRSEWRWITDLPARFYANIMVATGFPFRLQIVTICAASCHAANDPDQGLFQ